MILLDQSYISSFFQLLSVFAIFILVLVVTYFTTRWIAGYQQGKTVQRNLAVVETLKITTNKYIQIIRAGEDEFLVIAVGKEEVHLLTKISKDQLKEIPEILQQTGGNTKVFSDVFTQVKEKLQKK